MTPAREQLILIFDGQCAFCTRAVQLLKAVDSRGRVVAQPFQKPGVPEAAGLTKEQCAQAAWAVTPGGRRYRGAAAVHACLAWAVGHPRLVALYRVPGLRQLEDLVYLLVARYRSHLPGATPYCQRSPRECGH